MNNKLFAHHSKKGIVINMKTKILNQSPLPEIPWQDRPQNSNAIIWRYDANPIIKRDQIKNSNSIFNSAVVPFDGRYAGVFRVDDTCRLPRLHVGFSSDGISWDIAEKPIQFCCDIPEIARFEYGYDPRVCKIEDKYYVTWCNGYKDFPTIGLACTYDFKKFTMLENMTLPFNRNGVLFPRKINGKYVLLSRPSDNGHTPFGDIFLSQSPDLKYWGEHRHVMTPEQSWERLKIGAGPIPIETSEGWLLIYHGALQSCSGLVYSFSAALLDINEPWKVIARAKPYLMSPQKMYECVGDTGNVVFPCAALCDSDTGRLALYYGCADTVTSLAFCYIDDIIDFVKEEGQS